MASPFLFSEGHRLPQQPTQRASDDLILLQQLLDIGAVDLAEDLLQGHLFSTRFNSISMGFLPSRNHGGIQQIPDIYTLPQTSGTPRSTFSRGTRPPYRSARYSVSEDGVPVVSRQTAPERRSSQRQPPMQISLPVHARIGFFHIVAGLVGEQEYTIVVVPAGRELGLAVDGLQMF